MKLGASYTIRPGSKVGLFFSSQTHTEPILERVLGLIRTLVMVLLTLCQFSVFLMFLCFIVYFALFPGYNEYDFYGEVFPY